MMSAVLFCVLLQAPKFVAPVCDQCADCRCGKDCACCDDLTGVYHLRVDIDGKPPMYGAVVVEKQDVYFLFNHASPFGHVQGVGFQKGKYICVTWKANGKVQGSTLYEIGKRRLDGTWIEFGASGIHRETLTFLRKLEDKET